MGPFGKSSDSYPVTPNQPINSHVIFVEDIENLSDQVCDSLEGSHKKVTYILDIGQAISLNKGEVQEDCEVKIRAENIISNSFGNIPDFEVFSLFSNGVLNGADWKRLSPTKISILRFLSTHTGKAFTKKEIGEALGKSHILINGQLGEMIRGFEFLGFNLIKSFKVGTTTSYYIGNLETIQQESVSKVEYIIGRIQIKIIDDQHIEYKGEKKKLLRPVLRFFELCISQPGEDISIKKLREGLDIPSLVLNDISRYITQLRQKGILIVVKTDTGAMCTKL